MIIVLGSQSAIKIEAIRNALLANGIDVQLVDADWAKGKRPAAGKAWIVAVKASSNVPEQPLNDETLQGARNRAAHARELFPEGDVFLSSLENGVFEEDEATTVRNEQGVFEGKGAFKKGGICIDRAVLLIVGKDGVEYITYSDGVEFDRDCVMEARRRGRRAADVMIERGERRLTIHGEPKSVTISDDPHFGIVGIHRTVFLAKMAMAAFAALDLNRFISEPQANITTRALGVLRKGGQTVAQTVRKWRSPGRRN